MLYTRERKDFLNCNAEFLLLCKASKRGAAVCLANIDNKVGWQKDKLETVNLFVLGYRYIGVHI